MINFNKFYFQFDPSSIKYIINNDSLDFDDVFVKVMDILDELELTKIDSESNKVLNETGKVLFGSSNNKNLDYRFYSIKVHQNRTINTQVFESCGLVTFFSLVSLMNEYIPIFQDRVTASTSVQKGITLPNIRAICLIVIILNDYSYSKDRTLIQLDPTKLTIDFNNKNQRKNMKSKYLMRGYQFIKIFEKLEILSFDELALTMEILNKYFDKNQIIFEYFGGRNVNIKIPKKDKLENSIEDYIFRRGEVTKKDIQEYFEIPERSVSRYLNNLINKNKIIRTTRNKNSPYVKYAVPRTFSENKDWEQYEIINLVITYKIRGILWN